MLKPKIKLELQAEADEFEKDGKKIPFTRYFVMINGIKIPMCLTKNAGQIGKNLLRDCFE